MKLHKLCSVVIGATLVAPAAFADFSGSYDPSNWTLTLSAGSNGFVDTSGAPASIALYGSDNDTFTSQTTDYTATVSCDGVISFDWSYISFDVDGPSFDPAGLLINGVFIQLSDDNGPDFQSGSVVSAASGGDTWGWRIDATDDQLGLGALSDLYNFSAGCYTSIDIKPGSDPNSINMRNKNGVIPVAILGSADFDVTDVDVTSLNFEGATPAHDLTDPFVYADHLQDVNEDGYTDLVSHYPAQDTGLTTASTEGCLTGSLLGGEALLGACDSVNVIKD
jgi:hypothetical protein